MGLLTYIASPKKLPEKADLEFIIIDITKSEPGIITHRCFKNKYVYSFISILNHSDTPQGFCPYEAFQQQDIDYEGNIISEAKKERTFIEWKYLVKISLNSRAALTKYIKQYLDAGDFLELYFVSTDMKELQDLPKPKFTIELDVNELQELRGFVPSDGYKFIIYI